MWTICEMQVFIVMLHQLRAGASCVFFMKINTDSIIVLIQWWQLTPELTMTIQQIQKTKVVWSQACQFQVWWPSSFATESSSWTCMSLVYPGVCTMYTNGLDYKYKVMGHLHGPWFHIIILGSPFGNHNRNWQVQIIWLTISWEDN